MVTPDNVGKGKEEAGPKGGGLEKLFEKHYPYSMLLMTSLPLTREVSSIVPVQTERSKRTRRANGVSPSPSLKA